MLQAWEEGPEQPAPPLAGAGLLQARAWVPPPQEALQPDQPDQPPLTGAGLTVMVKEDVPSVLGQLIRLVVIPVTVIVYVVGEETAGAVSDPEPYTVKLPL